MGAPWRPSKCFSSTESLHRVVRNILAVYLIQCTKLREPPQHSLKIGWSSNILEYIGIYSVEWSLEMELRTYDLFLSGHTY
jgi:hypothetical protein